MPRSTPRPSPEERARERLAKTVLDSTDKLGRTRRARAAHKQLSTMSKLSPAQLNEQLRHAVIVPSTLNGLKIYSGKSRSFEATFMRQWWEKQDQPWTCWLCDGEIDPKGKGKYKPSIDHKTPWSQVKLEIPTEMVCLNGVHWEVALAHVVRAVIQDESNLAPSHQGCNSSKNGTKLSDSIAPQKRSYSICLGEDCDLPKAE